MIKLTNLNSVNDLKFLNLDQLKSYFEKQIVRLPENLQNFPYIFDLEKEDLFKEIKKYFDIFDIEVKIIEE